MADIFREILGTKITGQLEAYHKENPLHQGMRQEELRSRVLPDYKPTFFDGVLNMYSHELRIDDGRVALAGFEVAYTGQQRQIRDTITSGLKQGGFSPPPLDKLLAKDKKNTQKILDALISEGTAISTEPGMIFDATVVEQAKDTIRQLVEAGDGTMTLAQFRDGVQTSRKFALSLLEYFDRVGFTRKLGDSRVLR